MTVDHVHSWEALDATHDETYDPTVLAIDWTRQRCVVCGIETGNVLGPGEKITFPLTTDGKLR